MELKVTGIVQQEHSTALLGLLFLRRERQGRVEIALEDPSQVFRALVDRQSKEQWPRRLQSHLVIARCCIASAV